MSTANDRFALLEQRIAELEGRPSSPGRSARPRLLRRLMVVGLALALTIPAGVALANHQFSDVPTGSSIHDDVEAIYEAGVTTGCGDGKYCPTDPVTRGQMAQFMNRLGALDGQAPSVNADRVDGKHASALIRVASWETADTTEVPANNVFVQYGPDLVITAPAAGFVTVNVGFTVLNSTCTTACPVIGRVKHVESGEQTRNAYASALTGDEFDSASVHRAFEVDAGANTFQLILLRSVSGNGTEYGWYATGTAMYSPFGSTGGSALGFDSAEVDTDKEQ